MKNKSLLVLFLLLSIVQIGYTQIQCGVVNDLSSCCANPTNIIEASYGKIPDVCDYGCVLPTDPCGGRLRVPVKIYRKLSSRDSKIDIAFIYAKNLFKNAGIELFEVESRSSIPAHPFGGDFDDNFRCGDNCDYNDMELISAYNLQNVLNIYVLDNINDCSIWTTLDGNAHFPCDGNTVAIDYTTDQVNLNILFAHELGHSFGLFHTHQPYNTTLGDCYQNDRIGDTDAQDNEDDCGSGNNSNENIMSYCGSTRTMFTECQYVKMNRVLKSCRSNLKWSLPKPLVSTGSYFHSNNHNVSIDCNKTLPQFSVQAQSKSAFSTGCVRWKVYKWNTGTSSHDFIGGSYPASTFDPSTFINSGQPGEYLVEAIEEIPWNHHQGSPTKITITVRQTSACPPASCILENCLYYATTCNANGTYNVQINVPGMLPAGYSAQVGSEVQPATPGATLNFTNSGAGYSISNSNPVQGTLFDPAVPSCNDVENIKPFPTFTPTLTADCANGRYLVTLAGTSDNAASFTVSDGTTTKNFPPATGSSLSFGPYNDNQTITYTVRYPGASACSMTLPVNIPDCNNPDPTCDISNVTWSNLDCDNSTVTIQFSGTPYTNYTVQEILNGNGTNAAAQTVNAGVAAQIPFNNDGSGLVSFRISNPDIPGCSYDLIGINNSSCNPQVNGSPTTCAVNNDEFSIYWPFNDLSTYAPSTWNDVPGSPFHTNGDMFALDLNLSTGGNTDCGEPVYAPFDGTIWFAGFTNGGYGNQVIIQAEHALGVAFRASHLQSIEVSDGDPVKAGMLIGYLGNTGTTLCHLHAAVHHNLDNNDWIALNSGASVGVENAAQFNIDCPNSLQVITANTTGQCFTPGQNVNVIFKEMGTMQGVAVQYCDMSNNCNYITGGNPFSLDNTLPQDTWSLPWTVPNSPGTYRIKVFDPLNPSVSAVSTNTFSISTDCGDATVSCNPPNAVTLTSSADGTSVTVSWTPVTGATGYVVEGKLSSSTSWTRLLSNHTNTSFTSDYEPCTGLDIRVAANCEDGTTTAFTANSIVTNGCSGPSGSDGVGGGFAGLASCPGDNDDEDDPIFINCPIQPYVFNIDNASQCAAAVNWSIPVAVDNCNVTVTQVSGPAQGSQQPAGTYSIVYLAEDNNNNTADCTFDVIVVDGQTLQFENCPVNILTFATDADICTASANWPDPIATDNCDVTVAQTAGPVSGTALAPGLYQVTYMATNSAAVPESEECNFTVRVFDTQIPTINCPQDITVENDLGVCQAVVNNIAPESAFDNCANAVTWEAPGATPASGTNDASGTIFPVGITTLTYTIAETANPFGNQSSTCDVIITVLDTELPIITCPASVTINTSDGGTGDCEGEYTWSHPTPTDNCGVTAYTINYTFPDAGTEGPTDILGQMGASITRDFYKGTSTMLYTVSDAAGNTQTCSFSVTVLDNEPPTIFCDSLVVCNEYSYQPDREIWPSDTITARIQVKNDLNITDLDITQLTGTHLSMGNLTATLVSPAGTSVVLFGSLCAGTTDFNVTLDDEAAAGTIPCAPLGNGGVWRPQNPLDAFDDESALGEWKLILTNAFGGPCGTLTNWQMRICGNNNETGANVLSVVAETDRCDWKANGTLLDPPFYDNCPDSTITHNLAMAPDMHTLNGTVFPVGQTPITWTATDASGNTTTCNIIVEVLDTQAPKFLNCPEPNVIQPAEPGICGAYVNFAQPIAVDNCMPMPVVTKTDATGLNSSSVFPVGTTIMNWLATDAHGNTAQCSVKVIVNDTQEPTLSCPADKTVNTDVWQCDAVVNGIAPASFDDNCDNNLSLVYQIRFPAATDTVIAAGVWNASGEIFPKGMATVDYRVADQPLLLITEVAQSIDTVNGGMMPVPPSFDVVNGDDYLEVTNFGPAALDVSCLNIERLGGPAGEQISMPAGTIMQPGQVLTIHFGNGEDNPAGLFFNVKCAADFATFKPSAYVVSYKGVVKDVAVLNGFNPAGQGTLATVPAAAWSGTTGNVGNKGGIYRKFIYDNNKAFDFALADVCHPLTIGTLNPDLDVFPANGSTTALQSIAPNEKSCSFKVTVQDKEKPSCGEWEQHDYTAATNLGTPNSITGGKVLKSVINVPQNFKVGDIDLLNLTGTHPNTDDLIFKLTSPEGTQAILFGGLCDGQPNFNLSILSDTVPSVTTAGCAPLGQGGQFTPLNAALFKFFGQNSQGNWTLEIADSVGINNGQLNGWTLRLQEIQPYSQMDTTFENDLGECGALFTWRNARFIDNCRVGTLELKYVTQDGINVPPTPGLINGGEVHTEFFEVGTTTVRYILRDVSGNVDSCEFDVTILDTERPVVVCPADITVQLDGGECRRAVFYAPASATDNCAVVDTLMTPPSGTIFEIGTHTVSIVIFDPAGNTDTCFFKVNILEHIPTSGGMVCNDLSHVSLDSTCVYKLDADAALEGDDYHCYEDYIITLTNSLGQNVGNTFTGAHVGQTFTVTVLDPETGNSCWGTLKLEDKLSPTITCPPNITILCTEDEDNLTLTGVPQWEDCSAVTTFHTDQYTQYDCAANQLVTASFLRKWTARDVWGNLSTCYQTISQLRGDLAQVVFPANIDLPCTAVPNDLSPDISGWPKIGNINLTTTSTGFCGLGVSYLDEVTHICPGTYKTIRTWKVIDWCTIDGNPITQIHVQYIKVNDQPPVMNLTNFEYDSLNQCYKLGVNNIVNGECVATGNLPVAVIDGVCNSIVELEISTPWGLVQNGGIIPDPGLSIGQYPISYTVRDACGNFMQKDIQVCVADYTPPLPVCDEWTQVALGLNGTAFVNASDMDDGSYDNCAPVHFKARRMDANACQTDTVFHDQVKFCCTDINDTINVILRVYDVDPGTGVVAIGAFEGHYNDCMVQVLVEDKIKPICTAPANVTVTCELFDPSLWAYGTATGTDNCCVDTIIGTVNYSQFDSLCNRGTITRNWTVKDCAANTANCSQKVIVQYNQEYYVKFPADKVISVCDGTGSYGAPTFYGEDCELLATSFVDEVFTVVPDACFKIERTWTVINWCTYTPNAACVYVPNPDVLTGPTVSEAGNNIAGWSASSLAVNGATFNYGNATNPGAGFAGFGGWTKEANCYQYKQIIKIIDTQDPVVVTPSTGEYCDYSTNDANYWNADYWWDNAIQSHNLCEGEADITITGIDSCSGANISFRYLLFLDLDGNGSMETVVPGSPLPQVYNEVRFDNVNTVGYAGGDPRAFDHRAVAPTQKWGWGLTTDTIGGARIAHVRWVNQQGQNAVPQLPLGTHKIKWTIEDGCGNEVSSETTFTVKDCKKPTVVCVNGLSINQMNGPANTVTLWASDFLQYGDDNCTPSPLLKYGIRKSGTGSGFPTVNGTAQTSVTFDCSELGTQLVELWAEDKAGNADFCETYVLIQDNMGVCTQPGMASIAGALKTETIQGVEDANVELDGSSNGTPMLSDVFSNISGNYVFSNALPITANATITPTLDADPLNGVNTWDLVLISRHILGLEPLNTPYKLIAADANKSGTVTTFDIVELRKLILGTYTALPNNESWRFIDKAQVFTNNENPFADVIRENLQIANIQSSITDGDFIGAKIGDVDGTATPNNLVSSDDRTAGILLFDVTDRKVKAGETFTVNFKAAQAVKGYQFTLNFSGLEVVDVVPGTDMTTENFGVFADAITTSADATEGEFAVTFRAKTAGQLSNMLGVSSRITKAVAFTSAALGAGDGNNKLDVAFRFNNGGTSTIAGLGFELYQNIPNPWVNKTTISFYLPDTAKARLSIFDETGRLLFTTQEHYNKGYNSIQLDRSMLPSTGTLYYTLDTDTNTATRKMLEMK